MDIYQRIWDADQAGNGVPPLLPDAAADPARGHVRVMAATPDDAGPDHNVLTDVLIPESKSRTYERVKLLFDNYALDEQEREAETPQERQEVHDLLEAVIDTPPMLVARDYVSERSGTTVSKDRWYAVLVEHWFRSFSIGGSPDATGFEHVFVGEQGGSKAKGYHFWFKYWLDDALATNPDEGDRVPRDRLPGFDADRIRYLRGKYGDGQEAFPETVTISYRWDAVDYTTGKVRPLVKPTGGFFVGCSVEGLMALGSVRAHLGADAPHQAVINGARYDLKLYHSPNNQNIRTFFPMYLGAAGPQPVAPQPVGPAAPAPLPPPVVASGVRIVAALVNPRGHDPGFETVTLINTGTGAVSLDGWALVDKMHHRFDLGGLDLERGEAATVTLPANSVQLSNRGGEIRLVDRDGNTAHLVTYSRHQAAEEGRTILF